MHFFQQLFSADFMPHGHCYFWRPEIVWLHVISDSLITLAYCSIPLALTYLVRKRGDIAFEWIFAMFGVFIFTCGTTHALEVVTIWDPIYRFAGLVKALTAVASVGCAIALWKLMPRMLALPSPTQLREINLQLEKEVAERTRAQAKERSARDLVEERVRERTAELEATNATLQHEVAIRTQAERDLRANEEQFHAVLDHSPTMMQVVDRAGRYIFVNRRFETFLEVKAAEVVGKMPREIFPGAREAALSQDEAEVIRTGEATESDVEIEHAGETHIYTVVKFPLLDAQGEVYAVCGSFRDITKRKQENEELHRAREEAERANAAKSDFLSRVSHELRTPLNAVLGFAQVLEMDGLDAQQQSSIEQILRGGRHLLELINELLDLSRLEAGNMTISPEPVAVNLLLGECVDLIAPLAKQRQITIERLFENSPALHALADAQRLKQVVINLLSNAVKYNHLGGSVALAAEEAPVDLVRIAVRDNGAGIAEADLGRVFNPFERISADAQGIEGTGLGLALSRRLVERMGGQIGVHSSVCEGSSFWVDLPKVETARLASKKDETLHPAEFGIRGENAILYIEDNLSNLQLIERIFAKHVGIKIVPALQGSVGLDLARQFQPTLILLDLDLPDMPGYEVMLRLRSSAATRAIPIVVISAAAMPREIERLLSAGANAYLTKPLDVPRFLRTVEEILANTDRPAGKAEGKAPE